MLIIFPQRTVKYITVFTDPPQKPCDFHLRQVIPSSAYVSVDQLEDLKRFDKVSYRFILSAA